jgi:hypothetical protein
MADICVPKRVVNGNRKLIHTLRERDNYSNEAKKTEGFMALVDKCLDDACAILIREDRHFIDGLTEYPNLMKIAIKKNVHAIRYANKLSRSHSKLAVKQDRFALKWYKDKLVIDEDIVIKAIAYDPFSIQYLEQNHSYCLAAVMKNGLALEYIKDKSLDICSCAVLNDPFAVKWVPNMNWVMYDLASKCTYPLPFIKRWWICEPLTRDQRYYFTNIRHAYKLADITIKHY